MTRCYSLSQVDGSDRHRYFKSAFGKDFCTVCAGNELGKPYTIVVGVSFKAVGLENAD